MQHYIETEQESETDQPAKSILKEIACLPFPEDVKKRADLVSQSMDIGPKRKKKRMQLLFFCLYQAHNELKIPVYPAFIASQYFGLTKGEMNKSLSMFAENKTGYVVCYPDWQPFQLIHSVCSMIDPNSRFFHEPNVDFLKSLAVSVVLKSKVLAQENPNLKNDMLLNELNPWLVAFAVVYFSIERQNATCILPSKLSFTQEQSDVVRQTLISRLIEVATWLSESKIKSLAKNIEKIDCVSLR